MFKRVIIFIFLLTYALAADTIEREVSLGGANPSYEDLNSADTIKGEVSLGAYSHSPSGEASYDIPSVGVNAATTPDDVLAWSNEKDIVFKGYIEHSIPIVPNVKVAFSSLGYKGNNEVSNFTWGQINIPLQGNIDTFLNLKMYDLTLYYQLIDGDTEIDAGLTLKRFYGDIGVDARADLSSSSTQASYEITDFDEFIPMLYGKIKINLPETNISLQLEANAINYNETTFYDYEFSARYTLDVGIGIEGGYRSIHVDSKDISDGLTLDMDFSGPFASVILEF